MSETNGSRVTNRELDAKLEAVRNEQKAEHWKTRLLVVALAAPSAVKSLPTILAVLGLPSW
jgi:hypothetical protein